MLYKDYSIITFFCKEGEKVENYTKYALKTAEELTALLEGKDNLFVVACNKCFKEFNTTYEPDLDEFLKLAETQGKTVDADDTYLVPFVQVKIHIGQQLLHTKVNRQIFSG